MQLHRLLDDLARIAQHLHARGGGIRGEGGQDRGGAGACRQAGAGPGGGAGPGDDAPGVRVRIGAGHRHVGGAVLQGLEARQWLAELLACAQVLQRQVQRQPRQPAGLGAARQQRRVTARLPGRARRVASGQHRGRRGAAQAQRGRAPAVQPGAVVPLHPGCPGIDEAQQVCAGARARESQHLSGLPGAGHGAIPALQDGVVASRLHLHRRRRHGIPGVADDRQATCRRGPQRGVARGRGRAGEQQAHRMHRVSGPGQREQALALDFGQGRGLRQGAAGPAQRLGHEHVVPAQGRRLLPQRGLGLGAPGVAQRA